RTQPSPFRQSFLRQASGAAIALEQGPKRTMLRCGHPSARPLFRVAASTSMMLCAMIACGTPRLRFACSHELVGHSWVTCGRFVWSQGAAWRRLESRAASRPLGRPCGKEDSTMLRSLTVNRAVRQGRHLAVAQRRCAVVALLLPLAALGWAVARPDV